MNEFINIDCIEYMKGCDDNQFDLAIVDPPYRDNNSNMPSRVANKPGGVKDFGKKPDKHYFDELLRISKNQIVWGANNFIEHLGNTHCFIFWYKQNPVKTYADGELAWSSFDYPAKCFNFKYFGNLQGCTQADKKIHPTQKPIQLYDWLLSNFAQPGQSILDTHLGSGSSAIAAYYFGCDFTGLEINKEFFDSASKRFLHDTRQQAMF